MREQVGRVSRLRMARLNNSAGSGNIGLTLESQIGGVWVRGGWDGACGFVRLLMESTVLGKLFAISENWLALGGAVSPWSERVQMPVHQEHRK